MATISAQITLYHVIDISEVRRYYLLQSSTLTKPAKPTTYPPSASWGLTEPSYTAGSTNSLYFTDCTIFSDASFKYSEVSLSSSYEAAKAAYNKANAVEERVVAAETRLDQNEEDISLVATKTVEIQTTADEAKAAADAASSRLTTSEGRLDVMATQISTILVDENGKTAMYQDETGWHFNITKIINDLSKTSEELSNLSGDVDGTDSVVSKLDKLMASVTEKTAYINMIEDENGDPCIELGKTDNEFRVRITNTAVNFLQGNDKIAWVNNKSLNIDKAVIENDLQIGEGTGFIWRKRANGNMGLRWVSGE